MIGSVVSKLSTFNYSLGSLCSNSLTINQFTRKYNGGVSFNFITALSGTRDYANKNFSNFYLTKQMTLDEAIEFNSKTLQPTKIYTTLNFRNEQGTSLDGNAYLKFESNIDITPFKTANQYDKAKSFGIASFVGTSRDSTTLFEIEFINKFECYVSYIQNNKRYYLILSDDAEVSSTKPVYFLSENLLTPSGRKLQYILTIAEGEQYITFKSTKNNTPYIIRRVGNTLKGVNVSSLGTINKFLINTTSARLDVTAQTIISNPLNTSFIEYTEADFSINIDRSLFDISSNYLLYKSGDLHKNVFNIITLKNICNGYDEFRSANNLLSSRRDDIYASNQRNYISISNDIPATRSEGLELNYVTYNMDYHIKPGSNLFTAPSSLNPYSKININDTKITNCGAFAYPYPYFADRVYKEDQNFPEVEEQYLCTWLSGAPGEAGVWVDRYYYPDRVTREAALQGKPMYNSTYDNLLYELINSNAALATSIDDNKFFDKRSDLTFEPNYKYRYERIDIETVRNTFEVYNYCSQTTVEKYIPTYYKDIQDNGGFVLAFKILAADFTVESTRNEIDAGLRISRSGDVLDFEYKLFDNATNSIVNYSKRIELTSRVANDFYFSFDVRNGKGYVYLNGVQVYKFDTLSLQYVQKRLLFGNIVLRYRNTEQDILRVQRLDQDVVSDVYLSLRPLSIEDEILQIFSRNAVQIDNITISLPGGMRNFTDNINVLNTLASNLKSKSNLIDININNIGLTNEELLKDIKNSITTDLINEIPVTTIVNQINFNNFK